MYINKYITLNDAIGSIEPIASKITLSMENVKHSSNKHSGQSFGYILYRTRLSKQVSKVTISGGIRDYATVYYQLTATLYFI